LFKGGWHEECVESAEPPIGGRYVKESGMYIGVGTVVVILLIVIIILLLRGRSI
jgi:hypothetical protein